MFDRGFGVGLTVVPVHPDDVSAPAAIANGSEHGDLRPARLAEMLPVSARSDADIAAELGRVSAAEAQLAAYKAELVAGLSRLRPASLDRPRGTDGSASDRWVSGRACLPGVSEFFSDELAMVINSGRMFAGDLALDCVTLVEQLPMTYAALADGALDWSRVRVISEMLGDRPRHVIEAVEAEVVPVAASLSQRRLRDRICRTLIRINALAARERLERVKRAADVIAYPTEDGMGVLSAELPFPLATACRDAVDTYAQMVKKDGDERPIGQIRAGVLSDLILRPWDTSRQPVTGRHHVARPAPSARSGWQRRRRTGCRRGRWLADHCGAVSGTVGPTRRRAARHRRAGPARRQPERGCHRCGHWSAAGGEHGAWSPAGRSQGRTVLAGQHRSLRADREPRSVCTATGSHLPVPELLPRRCPLRRRPRHPFGRMATQTAEISAARAGDIIG